MLQIVSEFIGEHQTRFDLTFHNSKFYNDDSEDNGLGKESDVWQFAVRNNDNQTAMCKICNMIIKTTNWSQECNNTNIRYWGIGIG
jgi:hypothetical protein